MSMLADDDADWLLASDASSPEEGAEATPEKVRPTVGADYTVRHYSMVGLPNPLPVDPSWVVPPGEQPKRLATISAVGTGAQFEFRTETGIFERRIVLPANHRRLFRFNLRILWPDQIVREHTLAWNPLTDNTQIITIQVNGAWAHYPLASENLRVLVDIQELNRAILVHKLTHTDLEVLGRTAESFDQSIIPPSAESGGTIPVWLRSMDLVRVNVNGDILSREIASEVHFRADPR